MSSNIKCLRGEVVQNIVVTFILVAMIVTGVGLFFGSLATNYPSLSMGEKYSGVMGNASAIYGHGQTFQNTTEGMRENPDTLTGTTGLAEFIPSAFGMLNFVQSFFTAIVTMSGLPLGWVINFMILLGIVVIAFAIANWLRGSSRGL